MEQKEIKSKFPKCFEDSLFEFLFCFLNEREKEFFNETTEFVLSNFNFFIFDIKEIREKKANNILEFKRFKRFVCV